MKRRDRFGEDPPRYRPVAVVDIGSNSVRLVVYDGLRRAAVPVFNEKILCALGRGVALNGKLSEQGMERATKALRRFRALCRQMGSQDIFAVATAAAREASNGRAFVARAEQALGTGIRVLTGKHEARLAALGVIAGIPNADGLVGDLGGGSLELIDIQGDDIRNGITLPVGPLNLIDVSNNSIKAASEVIDRYLDKAALLERLEGREFYAVGGAWRNIARLHMAQNDYPLHVIHHYRMTREQAGSVSRLVAGLSPTSLQDISVLSRSRSHTLPYGALVMERLLSRAKASGVLFSVYGLREGLLFSKLRKRKRHADPLLTACWDFARRYARSPDHELELCDWTDELFGGQAASESPVERRLRHAACLLADIGWRAHPEYRGDRSLNIISHAAFVGVDHPGRVYLALTIFFRYEGLDSEKAPRELVRLLDDRELELARQLAGAQRLAYVLTAAMPGILPSIRLSRAGNKTLSLTLPSTMADLLGERVEKRLGQLADLFGLAPNLEIE